MNVKQWIFAWGHCLEFQEYGEDQDSVEETGEGEKQV